MLPASRTCGEGFSHAPWTDDASSGISLDSIWAYRFGSADSMTIDGFPVTGVAGGAPVVAGRFSVNIPSVFGGDTNELTTRAGSGSAVLATSFIYGGNPGTITLEGLVPGHAYVASILSVGFEAAGNRVNDFSSGTHSLIVDQDLYGDNKGIRVDYAFTAGATSQVITISPQTAATWHLYGLALRQVKDPIVVTTLADSGPGSLREALQSAAASAGVDRIVFDPSLDGQTVTLASEFVTADAETVVVDASTLPGGIVLQGGGGHWGFSNSGSLILRGLTITGMEAPDGNSAGAVRSTVTGKLVMEDCHLTDNDGGTFGGAIVNAGVATLRRCSLSGNRANTSGAIRNTISANLTLIQCTIAGNTSNTWWMENSGIVRMRHCTVAANEATTGSGSIMNRSGATLLLENCIIGGGNSGSLDLQNFGTLTRVGANLAEWAPQDSGTSSGPAITVAAPMLGPLSDNGGRTPTIALLAGSPAIDAAVGSWDPTDQRGAPRPFDGDNVGGAVADLGALEQGSAACEIEVFVGASTAPGDGLADNTGIQAFAETDVGASDVRTFTIRNLGPDRLNGLAVSLVGTNPDDFVTSSLPATVLVAGGTMTFNVTFAPSRVGSRSATLVLASTDLDENPFEIPLAGTGLGADIEVDPGSSAPGIVIAWGDNSAGQAAVPPEARAGVTAIASGHYHSLALKSDGSVVAWGVNSLGQTQVPHEAQSGVIAISAGDTHSLALKSDGTVVAWGTDYDPIFGSAPWHVASEAQSGVTAISSGINHSAVLKDNGSVIVWGRSTIGVPEEAQSGVVAVDAEGRQTLALKSNGRVVAWGDVFLGAPGVPVEAQSGMTAIAAGSGHAMALRSDGRVLAWGSNSNGETAVPAAALAGVRSIDCGTYHSLAIKRDGSLVGWGFNNAGQATPIPGTESSIVAVAGGNAHTLALKAYTFGTLPAATDTPPKTVTIRNRGNAPLVLGGVVLQGTNPDDFILDTGGMAPSLPPGGETTFQVTFAPQENGTSGRRWVEVRISSNDPAEAIHAFTMDGGAASSQLDTDADGMNDSEEARLAAVGFDWQVSQPQLVGIYDAARADGDASLLSDPNAHELYTPGQVQALRVVPPHLQHEGSGQFKLTIGLERSATLLPGSYLPFPFTGPETGVDGEGKLQFLFTLPDDAAFLRIETP